MNFFDSEHSISELIFHGAQVVDYHNICPENVLVALKAWQDREDKMTPGQALFELDNCAHFVITDEGWVTHYWPDEKSNIIAESLVRDFLFNAGIPPHSKTEPILFRLSYDVLALQSTEYLIICPYLRQTGSIAGLVAVCVTKSAKNKLPIFL